MPRSARGFCRGATRRGCGRDEAPRRASLAPPWPPRARSGAHTAASGGRAGPPARPPLGAAAAAGPGRHGTAQLRPRLQRRRCHPPRAASSATRRRSFWQWRSARRWARRRRWRKGRWRRTWRRGQRCQRPPPTVATRRLGVPSVPLHQFWVQEDLPPLQARRGRPTAAGTQRRSHGRTSTSIYGQAHSAPCYGSRGPLRGGPRWTALFPRAQTSGGSQRHTNGRRATPGDASSSRQRWYQGASLRRRVGATWQRRRCGPRCSGPVGPQSAAGPSAYAQRSLGVQRGRYGSKQARTLGGRSPAV